jgi:ribosomal protein S18 acetylase RimI-like enzyme
VSPRRLGPGSAVPEAVRRLDEAVFGEAWGDLSGHEHLWMTESAFARWSVIPAAGEAELVRIAVAPEARGHGFGRTLLELCQAALAAEGIRELHLEVRASNAAAQALYRRCGWREVGRRPGYYRDGEDALLFSRHL